MAFASAMPQGDDEGRKGECVFHPARRTFAAAMQACPSRVENAALPYKTKQVWERTTMRRWLSALCTFIVFALPASIAQAAADYPTRPIRLIVGFAPGGATDVLGRLLSGELSAALGQTVFVENIAGASGYLAWKAVADAHPDGYTLLMAENALVIRPAFKDQTPPFDPVTRLGAVAALAPTPLALV